jgi:hypothetical protein
LLLDASAVTGLALPKRSVFTTPQHREGIWGGEDSGLASAFPSTLDDAWPLYQQSCGGHDRSGFHRPHIFRIGSESRAAATHGLGSHTIPRFATLVNSRAVSVQRTLHDRVSTRTVALTSNYPAILDSADIQPNLKNDQAMPVVTTLLMLSFDDARDALAWLEVREPHACLSASNSNFRINEEQQIPRGLGRLVDGVHCDDSVYDVYRRHDAGHLEDVRLIVRMRC